MTTLTLFTPAGVLLNSKAVRLAARRLAQLGYDVQLDDAALLKHQRFGGDDAVRLAAIHRVAQQAPGIALATRGGYGLTRLLDRVDWKRLARSVERGTRWVGHSDMTTLQLGLLAHVTAPARSRAGARQASGAGAGAGAMAWAGPLAVDDFGREAVDDVTQACFIEAMSGELEAVGFRTEAGFDGLSAAGTLWGGNLCMVNSLLGTRHWPAVKGGILFLEDVNEHPYRIERNLLQLHQAGVLAAQKAVLLGAFSNYKKSPLDRGFTLKSVVQHLRSLTRTPILTGLPFGHVPTKVCLPVGATVQLLVQGRDVLLGW